MQKKYKHILQVQKSCAKHLRQKSCSPNVGEIDTKFFLNEKSVFFRKPKKFLSNKAQDKFDIFVSLRRRLTKKNPLQY